MAPENTLVGQPNEGILTKEGGRLSTVELLIKVACFVKEENIFFNIKNKLI